METIIAPKVKVSFPIDGGKFFDQNPEKLLAEPYEASGRFGPVTKYKVKEGSDISQTLKNIETPEFIGHGVTDLSAGVSVITPSETLITPDDEPNIIEAIKETEKEIVKKKRSKKRIAIDFDEPSEKPLLYFEDVLEHYNPDLTRDEIKAFLWYMHQQGNTYYGKWLHVFNPMLISQEQEAAFIKNWVTTGVLFYFKTEQ